jgi:hypothetical protein
MKSADSQTPVALTAPSLNRGTAFTHDERRKLGLTDRLPSAVLTPDDQYDHLLHHIDDTAPAYVVRAFPAGIGSETSVGVVMSGPVGTSRLPEKPAQISDAEKLARIRAVIDHPGVFHWDGQDVARVIRRILEGDL